MGLVLLFYEFLEGARMNLSVIKLLLAILILTKGLAVHAACPSAFGRFVADGGQVIDNQTGLVWQRCSLGQSWSGSACIGVATKYTHEQALSSVKNQNGWRLPNIKELASLIDVGCVNPAIDQKFFPDGLSDITAYWSSTPYVGISKNAWFVNVYWGTANFEFRNSGLLVRLVSTGQ